MTGILGCERGVAKFVGCERGVGIAAERIGFDVVEAPHAVDNDHSARVATDRALASQRWGRAARRPRLSGFPVIARRLTPTVLLPHRSGPGIPDQVVGRR